MDTHTMSILSRYLVWAMPPLMCVGLALLVFSIVSVVKAVKAARLFSVPMASEQEVEFRQAGTVAVCVQGPQSALMFKRFSFEMTTPEEREIRGWKNWFPTRTSGFSWVRLEIRRFDIPGPGRYILRARGMGDSEEKTAQQQIVFMRPHLLKSVVCVIGILAGAGLFIVNLVFSILHISGATTGA